jgi:Cu/Ag efflux pump CusA
VGQIWSGNLKIGVIVILDSRIRSDPEKVANLWLNVPRSLSPSIPDSQAGNASKGSGDQGPDTGTSRIQLKQVANVFLSDGRFLIAHEGGLRRQLVTCQVQGRDVESFVNEAERRIGALTLPEGVSLIFTGEREAKRAAQRELFWLGLAAGAGILLFLGMAFGSLRPLLLVLVNLPFALVGGIAAVYLMGGVLDVGALVGFVTLLGITMRNSIMMVSHWQHLHEVEGVAWGPELVFRGARERLAPVLMTATVTALGLLPIALGSGEAGREIEGPMALVILAGLLTSTALNLFVLPVLYRHFGVGRAATT